MVMPPALKVTRLTRNEATNERDITEVRLIRLLFGDLVGAAAPLLRELVGLHVSRRLAPQLRLLFLTPMHPRRRMPRPNLLWLHITPDQRLRHTFQRQH